jgi:hypothetical protein
LPIVTGVPVYRYQHITEVCNSAFNAYIFCLPLFTHIFSAVICYYCGRILESIPVAAIEGMRHDHFTKMFNILEGQLLSGHVSLSNSARTRLTNAERGDFTRAGRELIFLDCDFLKLYKATIIRDNNCIKRITLVNSYWMLDNSNINNNKISTINSLSIVKFFAQTLFYWIILILNF